MPFRLYNIKLIHFHQAQALRVNQNDIFSPSTSNFQLISTLELLSLFAGLLDALAKGLLSDSNVIAARILAMNISNGVLTTSVWWDNQIGTIGGPTRIEEDGVSIGLKPDTNYPW